MIDEKLKKILLRCKFGVFLKVNEHRDYYQTVEEYFSGGGETYGPTSFKMDISENVWSEMVKTNTIVDLQCYPNTPGGFHNVYHFDIEAALDEMIIALGL